MNHFAWQFSKNPTAYDLVRSEIALPSQPALAMSGFGSTPPPSITAI